MQQYKYLCMPSMFYNDDCALKYDWTEVVDYKRLYCMYVNMGKHTEIGR